MENDDKKYIDLETYKSEYDRISASIEARAVETNDVLKYTALSAIVIISWLATNKIIPPSDKPTDTNLVAVGWTVPLILCILGLIRHLGVRIQTKIAMEYRGKLDTMCRTGDLGFQSFYNARIKPGFLRTIFVSMTDVLIIYVLMIAMTGYLAFDYGLWKH